MPRVNRVLVAVSGSAASFQVLRMAAGFARRTKSSLTALAVAPAYEGDLGLVGVKGIESVIWEPCGKVLAELTRVTSEEGIYIRPAFSAGKPHECIIEQAEARKSDLIIMGVGRLRSITRFILGSETARVLRCASTDVLIIPQEIREGAGRVLAVTDGFEHSQATIGWALDVAWLFECELVVASLPGSPPGRADGAECSGGGTSSGPRLSEVQNLAGLLNVRFQHLVLQTGTCREICEIAEDHGADLMVLSSSLLTGKKPLLAGSAAEAIICGSSCAVLVTKVGPSHPLHRRPGADNRSSV